MPYPIRLMLFALLLALFIPASLRAAPNDRPSRDLCPTRPGLGTAPCIVDPGYFFVELGLVDWSLVDTSQDRTDTILTGDVLVRYGLTDASELQFGWESFGHVRRRDRSSSTVERSSGIGDATVGFKYGLRNPDGRGMSVAIQAFATLPIGGQAIGSGDWAAGVLLPTSWDLTDNLQLQITPELDANVDEDRNGRHLTLGAVAGLGIKVSDAMSLTIEGSLFRDRDPSGHITEALAALSLAWQSGEDTQFDIGTNVGLNGDSPDLQLYLGVSRRF